LSARKGLFARTLADGAAALLHASGSAESSDC
jgi:hypothetical protein